MQCTIAHALEKTKYPDSDIYWKKFEEKYHFSCQFTADLIAMNHTDFIITSTYQEIAGRYTLSHSPSSLILEKGISWPFFILISIIGNLFWGWKSVFGDSIKCEEKQPGWFCLDIERFWTLQLEKLDWSLASETKRKIISTFQMSFTWKRCLVLDWVSSYFRFGPLSSSSVLQ